MLSILNKIVITFYTLIVLGGCAHLPPNVAGNFNETYKALSSQCPEPHKQKQEHGIKFALQYVGLHDFLHGLDDRSFRIKPKLHLFLHITSDNSLPRLIWTYRDEDFGGSVARMARRRGGLLKCGPCSGTCLSKFKISNPSIRIV